jgi:hypothetical protein
MRWETARLEEEKWCFRTMHSAGTAIMVTVFISTAVFAEG